MKTTIILVYSLLALNLGICQSPKTEPDISGNWYSAQLDRSTITIYRHTDGLWYSKIISSDKKEFIGKTTLKQLKYNAATNTYEGGLTPPDKNINLSSKVTIEKDGRLKNIGSKLFLSKT
jgi:hypothetical protein